MVTGDPDPGTATCWSCFVVLTSRSNVPLKLKPLPLNGFEPPTVKVSSPAIPRPLVPSKFGLAIPGAAKIKTPFAVPVNSVLPATVAVSVPLTVMVVVSTSVTPVPLVWIAVVKMPLMTRLPEPRWMVRVPLATTWAECAVSVSGLPLVSVKATPPMLLTGLAVVLMASSALIASEMPEP